VRTNGKAQTARGRRWSSPRKRVWTEGTKNPKTAASSSARISVCHTEKGNAGQEA
jgi:hypothetical protein